MGKTTRLKLAAAAVAVAAAGGTAAAVAATQGTSKTSSTTATTTTASGTRPAQPPQGGPGVGFGSDLNAAASYLGVSKAKLQVQLRAGKTLAGIASATSGKSTAGLIAAIVAAETKQIAVARSAGKITAAQQKSMLARIEQRVKGLVNGTRPSGSPPGGKPPATKTS